MQRVALGARQVEHQPIDRQLREARAAARLQPDAQRAAHVAARGRRRTRQIRGRARHRSARELQRPQRQIVRGAKLARGLFGRGGPRAQRGARRQPVALREAAFVHHRRELHDRHRRKRRDVTRIHRVEQRLREARKLRVHLQLHARGEKAEAFEQPLDVRIGRPRFVHPQARGHFRKLLRELAAQLAQIRELAVVVVEQARIHRVSLPPPGAAPSRPSPDRGPSAARTRPDAESTTACP